jgi:hypothetical protein
MNANCVFPKVYSGNDLGQCLSRDLSQLQASSYVHQRKKLASKGRPLLALRAPNTNAAPAAVTERRIPAANNLPGTATPPTCCPE